MYDHGFIQIDEPHLWVDENGKPINDGNPPFKEGDMVRTIFDEALKTGTVCMLACADDYTFRVQFPDGSWGKYASWELESPHD